MNSSEIRQSFLDFFKSKQHTIVPSSSLLPDAPNLLFTNAGMNQFVPIFLGEQQCPYAPPRAADTQKCIRAGGKHNDLEDVGLDTYHHTFFEMLGNWSFGDYFKKEAIEWAWELITQVWGFPPSRLYATVYSPNQEAGDPADFDQEAYDIWERCFRGAGLDPKTHIVFGGKKDNFWMMGETGPCGPCSELHVDLTKDGNTKGSLVNQGSGQCMEIWNLVFIQFNANPDGSFVPLPARHVDTGMGFERVTGIMQNTKRFRDFSRVISNYETDIFRPLFDELEKLSGKRYGSTLPAPGATQYTEQEKVDIAFRVIADHIRTLGFAIADGIRPGNNEREYVLRRILRRAVRYGRTLGFQQPFFYRLARVLASSMGAAFPELPARLELIEKTIRTEEEAFGKTLDAGLELFQSILRSQERWMQTAESLERELTALDWKAEPEKVGVVKWTQSVPNNLTSEKFQSIYPSGFTAALQEVVRTFDVKALREALTTVRREGRQLSGAAAFLLADTHGFPLDLTELMAREAGFQVDVAGFKVLMEEQKRRAQAEKKRQVISLSSVDTSVPTRFNGYEESAAAAEVLEVVAVNERTAIVVDASPFYAEMGGQVGDAGEVRSNGHRWHIVDTRRVSSTFVHILAEKDAPARETKVHLTVDRPRRAAIERHHTVTHLLHWALHEVVSRDAAQKGSFVGVDKLTFDFNSSPLTAKHLADVERLVNERILENAPVSWAEVPYGEVKERRDIMQFFGEKYGSKVRVVQIGGQPSQLNGFSMELCAGTHTRATGELGLFRIVGESATGAGVRRIEALAGLCAYDKTRREMELIATMAGRLNTPIGELEKRLESLLVQQKEMEKQLKSAQQREAADIARTLLSKARALGAVRLIVADLGTADGDYLQTVADALKGEFKGVVVLGGVAQGAVSLVATVSPEFVAGVQAGRIMQTIAAIVGGKGGGRPDNARGGGKDPSRLKAALDEVENLIPKP